MGERIVGYTSGVFDLFHIGHLNILRSAKENCDHLIVGITTDEETKRLKGECPVIPFEERVEIVKAIRYVDEIYEEFDSNKLIAYNELKFDILFKGDDWKNSGEFKLYRDVFDKLGVGIKFFPYTQITSSSYLKEILFNRVKNQV